VTGTTYNQSALSTFTGTPVVTSAHATAGTGTDNSTLTQTQASATTFSNVSTIPGTDTGDFTYSTISWGYFDTATPPVFHGTGGSLGTSVTLALNGTVGKVLDD